MTKAAFIRQQPVLPANCWLTVWSGYRKRIKSYCFFYPACMKIGFSLWGSRIDSNLYFRVAYERVFHLAANQTSASILLQQDNKSKPVGWVLHGSAALTKAVWRPFLVFDKIHCFTQSSFTFSFYVGFNSFFVYSITVRSIIIRCWYKHFKALV